MTRDPESIEAMREALKKLKSGEAYASVSIEETFVAVAVYDCGNFTTIAIFELKDCIKWKRFKNHSEIYK